MCLSVGSKSSEMPAFTSRPMPPGMKQYDPPPLLEKPPVKVDFVTTVATAAAVGAILSPIERVQIMLQTKSILHERGRLPVEVSNVRQVTRHIINTEGLPSLWRGVTGRVLQLIPSKLIEVVFKDALQAMFPYTKEDHGYGAWLAGSCASSSAVVLGAQFAGYPFEFARTRLAADALVEVKRPGRPPRMEYECANLFQLMVGIYEKENLIGYYRGFSAAAFGAVFRGVWGLGLYDAIAPSLPKETIGDFGVRWCAATGLALVGGILSYPCDVVSRRMMMASGTELRYSSAVEAAVGFVQREGVSSLFRGVGCYMWRAPLGAVLLVCADEWRRQANEVAVAQINDRRATLAE